VTRTPIDETRAARWAKAEAVHFSTLSLAGERLEFNSIRDRVYIVTLGGKTLYHGPGFITAVRVLNEAAGS